MTGKTIAALTPKKTACGKELVESDEIVKLMAGTRKEGRSEIECQITKKQTKKQTKKPTKKPTKKQGIRGAILAIFCMVHGKPDHE